MLQLKVPTDKVQLALSKGYTKVFEIPFNSTNKYMVTVHRRESSGTYIVTVKGAPD